MSTPNIQVFEVGGSIRDEILGVASDDRDFCASSARGWGALLSWTGRKMRVFKVEEKFFTIRAMLAGDVIDIVMCRKDGASSDGRRPDEVTPGTLRDDLARRDFTCNAMARLVDMDLNSVGEIVDPFGGQQDLANKVLRSVGSAQERFDEDNLRLLRAVRFWITKGLTPDDDLMAMISSAENWRSMQETIPHERIQNEVRKIMLQAPERGIRILATLPEGALAGLFGGRLWLKPTLEKKKA
jgi:tRNA nucleotidyltransferase/poly(A) polymerase|tara:strand:- start:1059 stop:1781 length:723 start_codon:yes stop_codon:yes gene_type:complete